MSRDLDIFLWAFSADLKAVGCPFPGRLKIWCDSVTGTSQGLLPLWFFRRGFCFTESLRIFPTLSERWKIQICFLRAFLNRLITRLIFYLFPFQRLSLGEKNSPIFQSYSNHTDYFNTMSLQMPLKYSLSGSSEMSWFSLGSVWLYSCITYLSGQYVFFL